MERPSDGKRAGSRRESAQTASADRTAPKRPAAVARGLDFIEGPDYFDLWMNENLAPSIISFIRRCCRTFTGWDILRRLHANRAGMALEALAIAIGAEPLATIRELKILKSVGLVTHGRRHGRTVYSLDRASELAQALDTAIRAYDDSREFRFALVYSIVRASHRGAVAD